MPLRKKPLPYFTALAAVGVLTLSACGSGDSAEDDAAAPEAPEVSVDEELAAMVPEDIREAGVISIGVEAEYAPGEYLDDDGETVLGFNVDLVTAALNKLGLEAEWVPANFDSIIIGVDSGNYDLGASSFTITEERMEAVNMVSYFSSGTQWIAPAGNPEEVDPDNACGLRIAVQTGTTHDTDIEARSDACVEAGEEAITIEKFQNQPLATSSVVSGLNDASLADLPTSLFALQETGDQLEFIGDQYSAAPYGVITHQEDTELADALAAGFNAIIEDDTYGGVLEEWEIEVGAIETSEVNPSVDE
ncbi:ABC transporter substrate-binding protein [Nocardiopsis sp. JB363]|uniref:ABC transporter substrate-binding protein n=1 Tax=Nocardiopsis sp. JB363 TaxID=1434837 RepID=UPI000979DADB|nr:ABC transporter substrate-binding protein [Nocardiopsis sp. JB363]SIO88191.1 extracellular solute-binding protein, family 3 [Nocardiopsis sp. JB363]